MCRALAIKIEETALVLQEPAAEVRVWQGGHHTVGGWRELCSVCLGLLGAQRRDISFKGGGTVGKSF